MDVNVWIVAFTMTALRCLCYCYVHTALRCRPPATGAGVSSTAYRSRFLCYILVRYAFSVVIISLVRCSYESAPCVRRFTVDSLYSAPHLTDIIHWRAPLWPLRNPSNSKIQAVIITYKRRQFAQNTAFVLPLNVCQFLPIFSLSLSPYIIWNTYICGTLLNKQFL